MKIIAKTLYGLEEVLSKELMELGATGITILNRAVVFNGSKETLYAANYCLRSALAVLMPVGEFRVKSKDDLYRNSLHLEWDKYLDTNSTFSVSPVVNSELFAHSGYAGLVVKDAIADYFRDKTGKRPSVKQENPDVLVNLHISHNLVTISLDSSVVPLFKRGYRMEQSEAPLNETLAAGILMLSGWNASGTLYDPMCGSGTFSIEAALIAGKIPPGKFRNFFGFQKWKDYDPVMFDRVKEKYNNMIIKPEMKIQASDISPVAVQQALVNISNAKLDGYITAQVSDFRDIRSDDAESWIFLNPPYGLRLQPDDLDNLYSMIGSTLKHNFEGGTAWLISSNPDALKHVGLKPGKKYTLFNGALECMLLKYELYQGTRKKRTT